MRMTRIGGPSIFVELDGWRILIDPTFDPPGRRYPFALGTSSVKTRGPAVTASSLGRIDLILVSHDHHADNLDTAGRAVLPSATHVITTSSGAKRLAMPHAHGLTAGESIRIETDGKAPLEVTATPCRHGPVFSHPIVGDVIGFAIRRPGQARVALWITGDSVLYPALRRTAVELDVDVAIVNAGGVGFPATGPLKYTMTGADAVRLIAEIDPRVAIPAHYDGWSHFRDGEKGMCSAVATAPPDIRSRIRWLPDGQPVDV
ncbi:MBL fold metallo-hydrolase [Leifsonia sp. Leaf264]|uniref:MBL fold metallo-hydrolase n=1 Tax=Leifsonia sp. Leaf264 TaxID=1736314 RepID=UPI0006FA61CE|nr:MBL fold metallo-hydrolase [Leifsonia sp. Leaf264]KQP01912.1 MBL fold metallo-hydrolase [Leifsonia sp. Leaf264]